MKISKLFHWLYAIVMLLPFILFVGFVVTQIMGGSTLRMDEIFQSFADNVDTYFNFLNSGLINTIWSVFSYLIYTIFGFAYTDFSNVILVLLTYWTCISLIWLIFDVLLYVPLLCHRWLDKGVVE